MYRVDITADLNDEDETGYVWTFLDEARDPEQIKPGALIVAGDEDTAAVCEVIDVVAAGDGTIVTSGSLLRWSRRSIASPAWHRGREVRHRSQPASAPAVGAPRRAREDRRTRAGGTRGRSMAHHGT
jgi:hypothetical protein